MYGFSHSTETPPSLKEIQSRFYKTVLRHLLVKKAEREQTRIPIDIRDTIGELKNGVIEELLALSNSRCAFCEVHLDIKEAHIHPYRPLLNAEPSTSSAENDCYSWLALEWKNLFPICGTCSPKIPNFFPVKGARRLPNQDEISNWAKGNNEILDLSRSPDAPPENLVKSWLKEENAHLIKPRERSFSTAFTLELDGNLVGLNERALLTIKHFNLNNPKTVKKRWATLEAYMRDYQSAGGVYREIRELLNFDTMEFGGSWYLYLREVLSHDLNSRFDKADVQRMTSLTQIKKTIKNWDKPGFETMRDDNFLVSKMDKTSISSEMEDVYKKMDESLEMETRVKGQPKLQAISIKNFKSLEDIHVDIADLNKFKDDPDDFHTPCLLLLGENANGKSTFLEALALATVSSATLSELKGIMTDSHDNSPLDPSRLITNTKFMGVKDGKQQEESLIKLDFHTETEPQIQSLRIRDEGENSFIRKTVSDNILIFAFGAHRLFETIGNKADDHTREFDLIDKPQISQDVQRVMPLFQNRTIPMNPEEWIISLSKDDRDTLVATLRYVIQLDGFFESIQVETDHKGRNYCQIYLKKGNNIFIRGDEYKSINADKDKSTLTIPLPLNHVSSGYRVIISLICTVLKGIMSSHSGKDMSVKAALRLPAIVIIDEIEVHLHPRWKLQVISGLRKALPNVTFIMSSHDPLCVRGMKKGEVIVFNRFFDNSNEKRDIVELIKNFPDFDRMTIGDILKSDLFQLFSANPRTDLNLQYWAALLAKKNEALMAKKNIALLEEKEKDGPLSSEEMREKEKFVQLAKEGTLDFDENRELDKFTNFTNELLPEGIMDVQGVIQEAVAEFIKARRDKSEIAHAEREDAIEKIKAELMALSGGVNA